MANAHSFYLYRSSVGRLSMQLPVRLFVGLVANVLLLSPVLLPPLVNSVQAQSTDRNRPTPLPAEPLSGTGSNQSNQVFFYSFKVGPGDLTLTLDVDAGSTNGNSVAPSVALQDLSGNSIETVDAYATPGNPGHSAKKVSFRTTTPLLLVLTLPSGTTSSYTYVVKLDGAIQRTSSAVQGSSPVQLQAGERAIVRFQLNNGVIQEIDLSQVQAITVRR